MCGWLHLQSHCAKEFYDQVKKLFGTTVNGVPFDAEKMERLPYTGYEFNGSWLKRGKHWIGDIVIGDKDEIIVTDYTTERKLSRLIKKLIGITGYVIVLYYQKYEDVHGYKALKDRLLNYLAIDNHIKSDVRTRISNYEWKHLHHCAVNSGAFDIAEAAFKELIVRKIGWRKAKVIFDEHYATHIKTQSFMVIKDE